MYVTVAVTLFATVWFMFPILTVTVPGKTGNKTLPDVPNV